MPPKKPLRHYSFQRTTEFVSSLKKCLKTHPNEAGTMMGKMENILTQLNEGVRLDEISIPNIRSERGKLYAVDSRGHEEDKPKNNGELRLLFAPASVSPSEGVLHLLEVHDKKEQQHVLNQWRPVLKHLSPPP